MNLPIIKGFGQLTCKTKEEMEGHPISNAAEIGYFSKKIYISDSNDLFLAKKFIHFNESEIFGSYLVDNDEVKINSLYKKHLEDLVLESAYVECLAPLLAGRLFKGILQVPINYLHVNSNNEVFILSQFIDNFSEFLSDKPAVKGKPFTFWQQEGRTLPKRKDLALSKEEANIIGVLYAVGMIFNHWDLLNPKLRNSGYINKEVACIVDWGSSLHQAGFGKLCDESTILNSLFKPLEPIYYNFDPIYYNRYDHAMPFDGKVYPLLKKSFVRDLFDMSDGTDISKAILSGLKMALKVARHNLSTNPQLFTEAINDSAQFLTVNSNLTFKQLKKSLNRTYYGLSKTNDDTYNLPIILEDRLNDLEKIYFRLKQGENLLSIAEEVRDEYFSVQNMENRF